MIRELEIQLYESLHRATCRHDIRRIQLVLSLIGVLNEIRKIEERPW